MEGGAIMYQMKNQYALDIQVARGDKSGFLKLSRPYCGVRTGPQIIWWGRDGRRRP